MSSTTQNQKKLFRIHVRPDLKPTEAIAGRIKDNQLVGNNFPVEIAPPEQWIPNFYEAKVVKIKSSGKYQGKFDWYDPNDDKMKDKEYENITVRYLSSCDSLDEKYQIENGFKPLNENEESGWIYPSGVVTDIPNAPSRFIEFYEHHEMNGDNPMRDRNNKVGFVIVNSELISKKKFDEIEKDELVVNYRKGIAQSDSRTLILSSIMGIRNEYSLDDKRNELLTKVGRSFDEYKKFKKIEDGFVIEAEKDLKLWIAKKLATQKEDGIFCNGNTYFEGEYAVKNSDELCAVISKKIVEEQKFFDDFAKIKKEINKQ